MGTVFHLPTPRRDNAGFISTAVERLPVGCRGAACPAFALCQGRCATRRVERAAGYPGGSPAVRRS